MSDHDTTIEQEYHEWVRSMGYRVTLAEIGRSKFFAEYRKFHSRMKNLFGWSYSKVLYRDEPGRNTYTFQPPRPLAFDPVIKGQEVFVFEGEQLR